MVKYRPIADRDGYRVGDDGSVWTRWKKVSRGLGGGSGSRYVIKGKWVRLKATPRKSGHLQVGIGGGKVETVHRLVLFAFRGPPPPGKPDARHTPDRNPANNNVTNLQWGSKADNVSDREGDGTTARGETIGMAKLNPAKVRRIRKTKNRQSLIKLCERIGISFSAGKAAKRGATWAHVK